MKALRTALLVATALFSGSVVAQTGPSGESLPNGLVRSGNVIMMAPISDTGDTGIGPIISGEKRSGLIRVLAPSDHDLYERAFEAAGRGDWIAARGLAGQGHDSTARLLIEWRYLLDKNSGATFQQISDFLKNYADWPSRDTLYARAEKALDPAMSPNFVLTWFGDREPASAIGKIRLGEALIATGSTARGRALLREGWTRGSFDADQELAIILRDGAYITPDEDAARLDFLLATNDMAGARRELSRVSDRARRVALVRFALRSSPASGARDLDALPDELQTEPGIVFDQARLLRQRSAVGSIPPLLVRAPIREMARLAPSRWWNELNQDARQALESSQYRSAYEIASHTGLTAENGTNYGEAEFLAGWIALRFLNQPQSALQHFRNLDQAVSRPISRARANYWEGRAYEAAGESSTALHHFRIAAESPETFYGQLALARLSAEPTLRLRDPAIDADALHQDYEHEALTRAVRILADLGEESLLRLFAVHDVSIYSDPRHIKLLAEDLVRMGFREVAVRVAKEASYSNIPLLAYSHPVISVPSYQGPGMAPEKAMVLGVIRQETEFDPSSVSGAGARGIIQVMPGSARHYAGLVGLPYRPNDLTADPDYDIRIGMAELAEHLSEWSGSYVLALASYNAGPTNVRRWISQFGDPRSAKVDPIDWIEEIPFSETRNYVQRVLENMQVYRNRLSGRDQKLQILEDLYRPLTPPVALIPQAADADATATQHENPRRGNGAGSVTVSSGTGSAPQ
jgi:soluble lytic murein transglycosylase